MTNDDGLKSPNLHTFWIKIKAEYPETVTKTLKSPLPFPTSYLCEAGFLQWQQPKPDYGGDGTQATGFVVTHHPQMGLSSWAPTDPALWGVVSLFHCVSQCNNNHIKHTMNVIHLIIPKPFCPLVGGKSVFHKPRPWCQEVWGLLV